MRGSRKFCQRGPTLTTFFFSFLRVDEGRDDPNTTKSGSSSTRQRNGIKMVSWWAEDESFVRRVITLTTFFSFFSLVDEGRCDSNTTKSGPSSAHNRNAIKMAFRWWDEDDPTLNAGLVAL